ncbi:MAG TPA: hypothetical protein VHZ55_33695, partial [Bryobacteraceae bacterium]|nr:hypothetical protein [Bryobacteraceae bacterium]
GCAPAEPASASPVLHNFSLYIATVHRTAANGNLPLFPLSHQKGALQLIMSAIVCQLLELQSSNHTVSLEMSDIADTRHSGSGD